MRVRVVVAVVGTRGVEEAFLDKSRAQLVHRHQRDGLRRLLGLRHKFVVGFAGGLVVFVVE